VFVFGLFTPFPRIALRTGRGAALAAWTLLGAAAWAQEGGGGLSLKLRATPMLAEAVARDGPTPLFATGDRVTGRDQLDTVIEGNAELRRPGLTLQADRMTYDEATDLAAAQGSVRVNSRGNLYSGPEGAIRVQSMRGFVLQPTYRLLANGGYGQGERIDFIDPDRATLSNADYTTCRPQKPGQTPDWILRARRLDIDQELGEGHAEGATLEFKGMPLIPIPSMSFPLTERRQSGWLPPTIGLDNTSGLNLAVPYYWNIAPNRDATLIPQVMSKRGVDLGGQFRYLESNYSGIVEANLLPSDQLRHRTRWGFFDRHNGTFDTGIDGVGPLGLNLNLNRVSDDNYWLDFPRRGLSLTTRLLANDASLSWTRGDFAVQARTLKWQVLTDPLSPILPPYDRSPELSGRWAHRNGWGGLDYAVETDYTRFQGLPLLTGQPNAQREYVQAQLARPFAQPWGFFTPAAQVHASRYSFSAPLADGSSSLGRTIPTLSLDSGLIFEREASYFGRAFRQTLEPRLKYVYTPYRNQSLIPNYDTGPYDFNFATIWADNAFVGHDRIADNNLLTAGLTSRLLDPATGAEAVRLGIAQRYRFAAQQVTLPGGAPSGKGVSDMMLGASINWDRQWGLDSVLQYDPNKNQSTRTTLGGRYSPGEYRTLSAAYRRERDLNTRQFDISGQWPLDDWGQGPRRWYGVGRLNYDMVSRKPVDAVLGVEYDAGCWIGRFVFSKLQTGTGTANKSIMFQLEFIGFSRVGVNPLRTLRENIPNYHLLRQETVVPSRFSNYD
jgi:LPS-assembly protein